MLNNVFNERFLYHTAFAKISRKFEQKCYRILVGAQWRKGLLCHKTQVLFLPSPWIINRIVVIGDCPLRLKNLEGLTRYCRPAFLRCLECECSGLSEKTLTLEIDSKTISLEKYLPTAISSPKQVLLWTVKVTDVIGIGRHLDRHQQYKS